MKLPVVFALLTALFWGLYGPTLQQSKVSLQSPFKPFVAIGLAYLLWGVVGGMIGMVSKGDNFSFANAGGMLALGAGTLGAWGAFTLTLAFYNQGRPYIVMPIVFGGAVTVSALYSYWKEAGHVTVNPILWVGIAGIMVCTVIVAMYSPHAPPKPKPAAEAGAGNSATAPHPQV